MEESKFKVGSVYVLRPETEPYEGTARAHGYLWKFVRKSHTPMSGLFESVATKLHTYLWCGWMHPLSDSVEEPHNEEN